MSSMNYGLSDNFQYFEVELDSLDNSGAFTSTASSTNWPQFRLGLPLENIAAIKILEAQIPFTYYVINTVNNTFELTEGQGSKVPVIIPVGNYNATSLAEILTVALNEASPTGIDYTVSYNPITYKLIFESDNNSVFKFSFGAPTNSGNINPRLYIGFPGGDTVSNSDGVLISPNAILITGQSYLYINSRTIGSDCSLYLPAGAFNIANDGQGYLY